MRNLRVLIFPCGSEIGLELYRSLCFAKEIELFGGSSVPDHGKFVYEQHIDDIPFVTHQKFVPYLNKVVQNYGIDYIIPAHDSVVLKLAEARANNKLSCPVVTSPMATCRIARSKRRTINKFKNILSVPHIYKSLYEVKKYPIFLKPDIGQGSKGTAIAHNQREAKYHLGKNPDLLILEYLPGEEFTVDCYTNKNGKLLFVGGRRRFRILNGISVNTRPVQLAEFNDIAEKINRKLSFRGMWFFQLKRNVNGDLTLMEIAPRLAGSMGMYRNLGINFALMNLYELEGHNITAQANSFQIEMDRALDAKFKLGLTYTDVYIDYDDCLIIKGKVNTQLAAFIFQCINKEIRLHLLTRSAKNIQASLAAYKLKNLFDSVIHLRHGERKSAYIQSRQAIFIDDSFAERAEVSRQKQIPVFAPDSVESLLS